MVNEDCKHEDRKEITRIGDQTYVYYCNICNATFTSERELKDDEEYL